MLSRLAAGMVSPTYLFTFILGGVAIPPICLLCVYCFRNPRVRGHVSGRDVALCYTYALPVFAVAFNMNLFINIVCRSGLLAFLGNFIALGMWTYALAVAFSTYPPVRRLLGVVLVTQLIAPVTIIAVITSITLEALS